KDGVGAMAGSVAGIMKPDHDDRGALDDKAQKAAVDRMAKALGDWSKELAGRWLDTKDGAAFRAKVSHWIEGHPAAIVAAALVAAVAAYAANANLPEIAVPFGLGGGVKATLGIDPGKIQSMTVEAAR